MIRRTIAQYDVRHSGDEADRQEIMTLLLDLAIICSGKAEVIVSSEKSDLICVTIETEEKP